LVPCGEGLPRRHARHQKSRLVCGKKVSRKLARIIESGTRVDKSCRFRVENGVGNDSRFASVRREGTNKGRFPTAALLSQSRQLRLLKLQGYEGSLFARSIRKSTLQSATKSCCIRPREGGRSTLSCLCSMVARRNPQALSILSIAEVRISTASGGRIVTPCVASAVEDSRRYVLPTRRTASWKVRVSGIMLIFD
jgi:hypothetical protein